MCFYDLYKISINVCTCRKRPATRPAKTPGVMQLRGKSLRLDLWAKHERKGQGRGRKSKKSSTPQKGKTYDEDIFTDEGESEKEDQDSTIGNILSKLYTEGSDTETPQQVSSKIEMKVEVHRCDDQSPCKMSKDLHKTKTKVQSKLKSGDELVSESLPEKKTEATDREKDTEAGDQGESPTPQPERILRLVIKKKVLLHNLNMKLMDLVHMNRFSTF